MFKVIIAVDKKHGLGAYNGTDYSIPWDITVDMKFFQDVTTRTNDPNKINAVIFGRNTWETIKMRPLKGRKCIVLSTKENYRIEQGAFVVKSLDDAKKLLNDVESIFICGGAKLYEEVFNNPENISELYLTEIEHDYNCNITVRNINYNYPLFCKDEYEVLDKKNNIKVKISFSKFGKGIMDFNNPELNYLGIIHKLIKEGNKRQTRNSITWSRFGDRLEFDLSEGFPLLTTKKVFIKGVFEELLWFLKGDTNSNHLSEKGVKIWEPNSRREFLDKCGLNYNEGDIGPMYGWQWCFYGAKYEGMDKDYTGQGYNQINDCLNLIKNDPNSRRILMTTYNPIQAKEGVLYPCHSLVIQWYVDNDKLSMSMYQRSADICCGIPFNIASSALLVHMFCEVINNDIEYKGNKLKPGRLIMNFGDIHLYEDHYDQAIQQKLRTPYNFPELKFKRDVKELTDFKFEDIELVNYRCYPAIPYKMIA